MLRFVLCATATAALCLVPSSAFAQCQQGGGSGNAAGGPRGFGQGNGANGALNQLAALNQLMALEQFADQQRQQQGPAGQRSPFNSQQGPPRPPQNTARQAPSPQQFVTAAMRFDADRNRELSEAEVEQVASAVVQDFLSRRPPLPGQPRPPARPGPRTTTVSTSSSGPPQPQQPPTPEQMADAFQQRAMTFDRDESGTLNQREVQQLAVAFLRTM